MQSTSSKAIQQKIKKWKEALSDLSKRNRLLYFKKDKLATVEVSCPVEDLYDKLVVARQGIPISSLQTVHTEIELLKRLKKLRQVANSTLEEKGINSLFVAVGMLHWNSESDKSQDSFASPILLVPASLSKEYKKEEYILNPLNEDMFINPILVQKLRDDFGVFLPADDGLQEMTSTQILEAIQQAVVTHTDWRVEATTFIGLFSYAKAVMIKDLTEYEDLIAAHPVLRALAGDLSGYELLPIKSPSSGELDSKVDPQLVFQVLEADSSQQEVIEAAKAGLNFVVQGPPGTGKSQTIANVIAELLGMGKRVLLVSEKETAIRVVYERLRLCGLGDACINLHHQGETDKKAFIAQLAATADRYYKSRPPENRSIFYGQLRSKRTTLNDHTCRLHTKWQPLGQSAYDIYGGLLKRNNVLSLDFIVPNLKEWGAERLVEAHTLLEQLAVFSQFFWDERSTIWAKSSLKSYSFDLRMQILEVFDTFKKAFDDLKLSSSVLSKALGVAEPLSLDAAQKLSATAHYVICSPTLPEGWPIGADPIALRTVLKTLEKEASVIEEKRTSYQAKYDNELIVHLDFENLAVRFRDYKGLSRYFKGAYWSDRKFILSHRKQKKAADSELLQDLESAIEFKKLNKQLKDADHPGRATFGVLFSGENPNFKGINLALNWLEAGGKYVFSKEAVAQVLGSKKKDVLTEANSRMEKACEELNEALQSLEAYFEPQIVCPGTQKLSEAPLAKVIEFVEKARGDLEIFQDWLEYKVVFQKLTALGLVSFLTAINDGKVTQDSWFAVLEKGILQLWLEYIHTEEPELRKFTQEIHEQTIQDFVCADSQQLLVARERLKHVLAERWKFWSSLDSSRNELQLLQKENAKQKRHLPIRKFIAKAKGLVAALKPCWMMSPLSVSEQIDPREFHFDTVLFDEASQVRTEDAVPAIIRASQVIVVGDNKQLPPSAFFATAGSDDEDEESDDGAYESVLDECWAFMGVRTLKWHYRSQDESLIAFSNRHFYESRLVTFPNATSNENKGVRFLHVPDGVYDHGGRRDNIREAEEVAKIVLDHMQNTPELSLGIIGFSVAQADAIREKIDNLGAEYSELEEFCQEPSQQFFLKPLESVQGDERDVIVLSVGYASDEHGVLRYNFGPLNRKGGERRLNVAVTRAKNKLILVSSLRSSDLDLGRTSSRAVALLKDYLAYAASNGKQLEGNRYDGELRFDSPFEEDVYLALRDRGYTVRSQIGCSTYRIDLGVVDDTRPGEFLLGVECDGATYHSSPTARDRDRLRQKVLEGLGWKFHRIWSREWFRDKPGQMTKLVNRIEFLKAQGRS